MPFDFGQPIPIQSSFESASGSSPSSKNVVVAGSDGTTTRTISVDENGKPKTNLHDGGGLPIESSLDFEGKRNLLSFITSHFEAVSGSDVPLRAILFGGSDGSKIRSISVDQNGKANINLHDGIGNALESSLDFEGKRNLLSFITSHYEASSGSDVPARSILMGGSDGSKIRTIAVDDQGRHESKTHDGSGNPIESALDVSGKRNILASMTHNIFVSSKNSSTANLNAGASFNGLSENNLNATTVQINIKADQPLTIELFQSNDGVNWDFRDAYYLVANHDDTRTFIAAGSYAKVKVTNSGTSATTYFNLQTILVPFQSVLPRSLTDIGNLKCAITEVTDEVDNILVADKSIYGSAITSIRINKLVADFSKPIAQSDVTTSSTGGGSVTSSNSMALLSTGTAVTASAKLVTNQAVKYSPGHEIYAKFTAKFTTPTNANSDQRIGLYDTNNGFFLGFKGTTFGITIRNGAVDTFIPRTSFNTDLLDANPNSQFERDEVPEAIDLTKINVFRIRFGWLGSANAKFEILSPDGAWIVFHQFKHPNSSATPSISSPDLFFTAETIKSSSDATNLVLSTASFSAGSTESPVGIGSEDVNGRKYVTANVASQTTSQAVYTVSTGRLLKITTLIVSLSNSALAAQGQLNIRDGNGGTIIIPLSSPASTNQSNAGNNLNITFPTPLRFSNAVYAQIASGTLTYSVTFVGYEQEA